MRASLSSMPRQSTLRVHTIRIKADRHRGTLTDRVKQPPVSRGNAGRSPGPEKNGASRDVKCSLGP